MSTFKTIAQLAAKPQLSNCVRPGYIGKAPKFEQYTNNGQLKVAAPYQRELSIQAIKKYQQLDLTLLQPAVIARRPKSIIGPNGGDYIIDGQHKAVMYHLSGTSEQGVVFPAMVYEHEEDATLEECEKIEAKIFYALNRQRRKLTKIDEIRAGVVFQEPTALWIERVLTSFCLQADGFGYDGDDCIELKSFNQFYLALTSDYPSENAESFERLSKGMWLWKQMFQNTMSKNHEKYMVGVMFRTCCLISHFIDEVLDNGREENFRGFVISELTRMENQTTLSKGYIDANAPRYIFHNILEKYKIYCSNNGMKSRICIGDETLKEAAKINKRFKRPDA